LKPIPDSAQIVEIGPREGFESIRSPIALPAKLDVIESMIAAGVSAMEIASFVNKGEGFQAEEATRIVRTINKRCGKSNFRSIVLVDNFKEALWALECGIREIAYCISITDEYNLTQYNRSVKEALVNLQMITTQLPKARVRVRLENVFGRPFSGKINCDSVLSLLKNIIACGANEVVLCDNIGGAQPMQVYELVNKIKVSFPYQAFGLHLSDAQGMALANVLAGLDAGITTFDSSVGGLGGDLFAQGIAGNIATEDLLNILQSVGIQTNIRIRDYLKAVMLVRNNIRSELHSHIFKLYYCGGLDKITSLGQ